MADRSISVTLQANIAGYMASLRTASKATESLSDKIQKNRQQAEMLGRGMVAFGGAIVGGLALATKAAIDWESAWTGVTKTVDGSPEQMAKLEGELRNLARTLPATHQEIASVAEAAGQLGIKRKNVSDFTETMIAMGETTNLTADDAATAFAQLANVMGTSQGDFDRMGSTVVALGNAGASTEKDIVSLAQRLSGAGKLLGASEPEVLALASAMADLGIEAELGGGAIQRTSIKMVTAVKDGGSELESFAEIAGTTASEFATLFERRPVEAINKFVLGLDRIDKSGGNVVQALAEVGIKGTQDLSVLLRLKGAGDLLTQSLDRGAKAWRENNALTEEAEKRYATAASKIQVAWNNIKDAAIDVGGAIAPVVGGLADKISGVAAAFASLPGPVKSSVAILGGIVGSLSLVGGGMLLLMPRIASTRQAMSDLGLSFGKFGTKAAGFGRVAGGVAAGFTAIYTAGSLINSLIKDDLNPQFDALGAGLQRWAGGQRVAGEAARILGDDLSGLDHALETAGSGGFRGFKESVDDFRRGMFGFDSELDTAKVKLGAVDTALAQLVQEGKGKQAGEIFSLIARRAEELGIPYEHLNGLLVQYAAAQEVANGKARGSKAPLEVLNGVLGLTAENTKKTKDELNGLPGALADAGPELKEIAQYWGLNAENNKKAGKALADFKGKWADAFASFANPMDAYNNILERKKSKEQESAQATADSTKRSSDSWEDYAGNVRVTAKDLFAELNKMTRAQRNWSNNMITLASRVSRDVLDYLAQLGPEGAGLVQTMVNMTDAEMRKFVKNMRNSGQIGGQEFAQRLMDAQPVLRTIANTLGQNVANKIAQGMRKNGTDVYTEAENLGLKVDRGVGVDKEREIQITADARKALKTAGFTKDEINRIMDRIQDEGVEVKWSFGGAGTGATASNRLLSSTGRAEGGILPGPPSSKDNMLVPMASGEYVVRASEVRKNLPLLEAINSGRGFAQGGMVNFEGNASSLRGLRGDIRDAIQGQASEALPDMISAGSVGAGVERWRGVAMQALALAGSPLSWIDSLLRRMNQESGGNPMAINLWDSNAAAGIPSKGLMQTIDPTFNAYAGFLRGRGVWDPLANIFASINYANARYGAAPIGWNQPGGYAEGGQLPGSPSGRDNMVVRAASGEYIVNADATSKNLPLLEAINSGSLEGFASGGLVKRRKAMREILSHLRGGGNLFEDFTFKGMSKLVDRFSTELSKTFHRTGREFSRKAIAGFLDARLPNPRQGMRSLARAEQPLFGDKKAARFDRLIDRFKGILPNSDDPLRKQLREMNKTMRSLSKLLHKADAHWFGRRVMQVRERMANLLKRRERIDDRLEKAISIRDKRISQRRDVAGGLRSAIFEQRNMVGGFGIDHDGSFNASDIAGQLEENLAKTRKFQRLLRQMRRKGFRANVIGQIAQAGPEEGMETAEALADSSKSEVQRINRSFVGIHKAAHNFSQEIGRKLYGAGIQAARGLVKGLRSRRRQIQRTMRDIARSLLRHMRRSLKIQSPSQEMAKLGDMTGQGFVAGLDRSMGGVRKVMDRRVTDMTRLRPFVPGQHGGYGRGDVHLTVNLHAPHFVGSNEDLVRVLRTEIRSNDTIRRELKKALNA